MSPFAGACEKCMLNTLSPAEQTTAGLEIKQEVSSQPEILHATLKSSGDVVDEINVLNDSGPRDLLRSMETEIAWKKLHSQPNAHWSAENLR